MKVLVIGDSCEDVFVYGECRRLNPEAPTPVFYPTRESRNLGMAANVAKNLESLGIHVDMVTNEEKISKKRIVDEKSNYILIRIDDEPKVTAYCSADVEALVDHGIDEYDAVVISDYNKGFLPISTLRLLMEKFKLSFIDTKKSFGDWILPASFIKVNEVEASNSAHDPEILKRIEDKLIVTLGEKGCKIGSKIHPTQKVDVRDVVGAGDSFFAGFVASYLYARDIDKAIGFANFCASQSVKKKGVATLEEMKEIFQKMFL